MDPDIAYPLLSQIQAPDDVRRLEIDQLPQLCDEVRRFLLESVSQSGGHLAAGLGAVELTVALHYVFDTPRDALIWDVGHQCYPHKILTGRKDRLSSIRKRGGLSAFLKKSESPYDVFGAGHSSTSISAAMGMAVAAARLEEPRKVVAIIGDGGMTAGMAYEALNHGGTMDDLDIMVVLNDNKMSISPNVGALSGYLTQLLSGKLYTTAREGSKKMLRHFPSMWEMARRTEKHVKGMVVPGTLFEELGFNYFGPVDGHDVTGLVRVLKNLHNQHGPRFVHTVTQKGKGYAPAEDDPVSYHGVTPFSLVKGLSKDKPKSSLTYTEVFGKWLCDMAARDERLVGITPAMCEGSGLVAFSKQYPERYFDVGIAEQHSVTFAAGCANAGAKPVVAIYSTFLQRAYDQLLHDVAIQNLPVLFAIDRAGVVGPDGPTHAGSFDLSYLRHIPNMVVMAPADENETRQMLFTGFCLNQPAAVRYPRGKGPGVEPREEMTALPLGRAEVRRCGHGIALLAFGSPLEQALEVGGQLDATVVNMRFVRPLDTGLLQELVDRHQLLVTLEDNVVAGGAGSAVNEFLAQAGRTCPVLNLGLPDRFQEHGTREELLADAGLDAAGIYASVLSAMQRHGLSAEIDELDATRAGTK